MFSTTLARFINAVILMGLTIAELSLMETRTFGYMLIYQL